MADDFEILDTEEVSMNNLQIYQQDKAMVDMQIATAKRYPRNLKKCIDNAITVVTLDAEIAASCTYSLNKGGKNITGPSVNLAKIILQQMGNVRAEQRVVGYDQTHVTCEAVVFDLERNYAIRTQIRRSIVGSKGRYSEDMATIVGNAGNSIALRNAVFAVFDASIIKKVYNAAKQKITGDVSDVNKLTAKRIAVFEGFKNSYPDFKLSDTEICFAVKKQSPEHITSDDIVTLIGFENSIKGGEMTLESIFRPSANSVQIPKAEDKSEERLIKLINSAKDRKSLEKLKPECKSIEAGRAYDAAYKTLQ